MPYCQQRCNIANAVHSSNGHAISLALKFCGSWARIASPLELHMTYIDSRRQVECTEENILQLWFLWWIANSSNLDTQQFIPNWPMCRRWCFVWWDKNYTQLSYRVYSYRIILPVHSTCPLVLASSRQNWCCARFGCLYKSCPNTMCFQTWRESSKCWNWTQHWCCEWFGWLYISGPKYM